MTPVVGQAVNCGLILLGLWFLKQNAWRAWLFLRPQSVQLEPDAPADANVKIPAQLESLVEGLLRSSFRFIGTHWEECRFRKPRLVFDYAGENVFASLFLSDAQRPQVELLTPLSGQGFVRTANFRRPALEGPNYFSGYLVGVSVERLVQAHLRRCEAIGTPQGPWDLPTRLSAGQSWLQTEHGRKETRRQHQRAAVWSLGAALVMAIAIQALIS